MADNVTNELLLEHLKSVQNKLSSIAGDISDIKSDMRSLKSHMAGFMQTEVTQDGALAVMQDRLDRIERRLEINDPE